jgi:hypothetical protein
VSDFVPRLGALRFKDERGDWCSANPRDPLYSTITMLATEVYSEEGWLKIYEDDEDAN